MRLTHVAGRSRLCRAGLYKGNMVAIFERQYVEWKEYRELDRGINLLLLQELYYMLDKMYYSGVAAGEMVVWTACSTPAVGIRKRVLDVCGWRQVAGSKINVSWSM